MKAEKIINIINQFDGTHGYTEVYPTATNNTLTLDTDDHSWFYNEYDLAKEDV